MLVKYLRHKSHLARPKAFRYKRDWTYVIFCAECRDAIFASGAQINAGKRLCVECR